MDQDLCSILDSFDKIENDLANCGKEMIQDSDLFQFDLLVSAVLNRSLALMNGFQLLIINNNYICAAHLVRLHLDSLMRLSAAWLVDDPNELLKETGRVWVREWDKKSESSRSRKKQGECEYDCEWGTTLIHPTNQSKKHHGYFFEIRAKNIKYPTFNFAHLMQVFKYCETFE